MKYNTDSRIVLTLDAGGTNFVFSAIQGFREITEPVCLPSNGNDLSRCLATIVDGFRQLQAQLKGYPVAISFAFPGPTDYANGIIGDLNNLPAFRGGVPLGPFLEEKFKIPVFISNDGDLFTYGEAFAGFLPYINSKFNEIASNRRFNNLLGLTLGTGFGAGIVRNGDLFMGDNSAAAEIWVMRSKMGNTFAEENISIRAIIREYLVHSSIKHSQTLTPKDIHDIALGKEKGDAAAAKKAFLTMGENLGDSIANAVTLVDGLVVIGGGVSAASSLFLPRVIEELNSQFSTLSGQPVPRMEMKAFNLEDDMEMAAFLVGSQKVLQVPESNRTVTYDPVKRIGVGVSKLGTSKAVALGAYAFALNRLDQ